jgi:ketosteroid isomerase-like protein
MKAAPALLAFAAACAHQPTMDSAASLAAAETAFAAHSVREDMRAAFLAHFDTDGVFVRGGWIVSNDFLRGRPAPPIVLDWRPRYVEVAASGDMGLSTGPSKITSRSDASAAPAYGQFVSVWRRDAQGTWKVAVDLGISHAGPALWDAPLVARVSPTSASPSAGSLLDAEARFARDARERGERAAYAAHGAQDLRLYRPGHAPIASRVAALGASVLGEERRAWTVERSETARSGDFGYARGRYAADEVGPAEGWYLRVWRREAGGWRIVMDVVNPRPKG